MINIKIYNKEAHVRTQLLEILEKVDQDFYPPLSKRKSLDFWLNLFDNGIILYAIEKDSILGFLAYYPSLTGEIYDKLMGCVNINPIISIKTDGNYNGAYLHFIAILPEYRNKGISSLLLDTLISKAIQERIPALRVISWSSNYRSLGLYKKHGFEEIHRISNERGQGIDSVYFEIKLPFLESNIMVRN